MAVTLENNDIIIEIFDDPAFSQQGIYVSTYNRIIQIDKDKPYSPISQHAIKVYRDNTLIDSAIILASGGGTSIYEDSVLLDDNNLIIRCCNKLFSLSLPELKTNWATEVDWATCFSIYKYQDTYISHGELSIARIDKTGKILWSFSGADIFVCINEGEPFTMYDTHIALTDFIGSTYQIDYDGKQIAFEAFNYYQQTPTTISLKIAKPWWKFW
ncbi:MAG: hypothetical protein QM541_04555 [Flavobacterium sp.]|nr:hypothetical protein [Flavobacterium sp.]